MSAFRSAAASFTPSPSMATMSPRRLERGDDAQLRLGAGPAEGRDARHHLVELGIREPLDVPALEHLVARVQDPELAADASPP